MSGFKFLFVNPMNNTGGFSMAMSTSLAHFDLYCMSEFTEENLLLAIDRIQVSRSKQTTMAVDASSYSFN